VYRTSIRIAVVLTVRPLVDVVTSRIPRKDQRLWFRCFIKTCFIFSILVYCCLFSKHNTLLTSSSSLLSTSSSARSGTVWAGVAYRHFFDRLQTIPPLLSVDCHTGKQFCCYQMHSLGSKYYTHTFAARGAYSAPPNALAECEGKGEGEKVQRSERTGEGHGSGIGPYHYFFFPTLIPAIIDLLLLTGMYCLCITICSCHLKCCLISAFHHVLICSHLCTLDY